jgi:glycosyltransferase involved in cell wall biosynthesis
MEKIDILLATYNGEKFVKEQIESILNQTYENFNLIISDDASTDNTLNILEEYEKKDTRIKVFKKEKNKGLIDNFEFLLKNVTSDYFMFSDQDDIWKKDKIEKSINKLKEESSGLVYTDLEIVDEKLNVIYPSYWKYKQIYKKIIKYNNFEALYLNNFVTGCTILAKSKYIKDILPLPRNSKFVLHDYWTALIISAKDKISYVEEPTIQYRQHKNNRVGSSRKSDQLENFEDLRNLFIKVKIEHFEVFKENIEKIKTKEISKYTNEALKYFENLKKVKYINLKNWNLFFRLYKYEKFSYTIQNFIILNIPILGKLAFKIKKMIRE